MLAKEVPQGIQGTNAKAEDTAVCVSIPLVEEVPQPSLCDSLQLSTRDSALLMRSCAVVACLTSIGVIATAAVVFFRVSTTTPTHDTDYFTWAVITMLYMFSLLESCACLAVMAVCAAKISSSLQCLLARGGRGCGLCCFGVTVILLILPSLCTAAIPICGSSWDARIMPPPLTSLLPLIRALSLTCFSFALFSTLPGRSIAS